MPLCTQHRWTANIHVYINYKRYNSITENNTFNSKPSSTCRLLKQSFKLQLPCMEPGENIYSFLCIYDHRPSLSLLSVLADLSHSHEVRRRSCSFLPIVGVGLFLLFFHCSCTSTEYRPTWVARALGTSIELGLGTRLCILNWSTGYKDSLGTSSRYRAPCIWPYPERVRASL